MTVEVIRVGADGHWWVITGPHARAFASYDEARAWADQLLQRVAARLIAEVEGDQPADVLAPYRMQCPTCGQRVDP